MGTGGEPTWVEPNESGRKDGSGGLTDSERLLMIRSSRWIICNYSRHLLACSDKRPALGHWRSQIISHKMAPTPCNPPPFFSSTLRQVKPTARSRRSSEWGLPWRPVRPCIFCVWSRYTYLFGRRADCRAPSGELSCPREEGVTDYILECFESILPQQTNTPDARCACGMELMAK